MRRRVAVTATVAVVALGPLAHANTHRDCSREVCVGGGTTEAGFVVGGTVGGGGADVGSGPAGAGGGGADGPAGPAYAYAYAPTCSGNGPPPGDTDLCLAATTSCDDGEVRLWVYRREVDPVTRAPRGPWRRLDGTICVDGRDAAAPAIARLPGLVRQEWREADLRASGVRYEPRDGGVVNVETIFHADTPSTVVVPVGSLLGYDVTITATATSYVWSWGDGTSTTTAGPGAPYPSRDVTHVYRAPGRYAVSVTVTYQGSYTVDGGPPQPIAGTVTVAGPPSGIRVREARAELVDAEGERSGG